MFEKPNVFAPIIAALSRPPRKSSIEQRPVAAVIAQPRVAFYDPNSLQFKDAQGPIVRDGPVQIGLQQIVHDGQPIYDRNASAGPIREFFARWTNDNRVKRVG
jgi:hypothetical protein